MDRYRLIEQLGTGGMSVVWRAYDEVLGRPVAVKLLAPKLLADPRSRRRIQAEARAAALLSHPHIAAVHDFGHAEDGSPYVVMELVEGRSLEADPRLPPAEALQVGAQVAAALAAVHARGLVHRDVKPANVMLTTDGAKLVDFGISAVAGDQTDLDDELLGTPAYLAPERLRGAPTAAATDVYALGVLLYKMLTGRLPWPAETTEEMLHAHRRLPPQPLPGRLGLPRAVTGAIRRCLAKAPELRPSAQEMYEVLSAAADVRAPGLSRPVRRRLAAAGAVVVAVGVVGACAASRDDTDGTAVAWAEPAAPRVDCLVQYTLRQEDAGTFAADLSVTNAGAAPLDAWSLTFRLPDGQRIGTLDELDLYQDGPVVRVAGSSAIPAGAARTVSLTGTFPGEEAGLPTGFAVNDTSCHQVLVDAASTAVAAPSTAAPVDQTTTTQGSQQSGGKGKGKGKKGRD